MKFGQGKYLTFTSQNRPRYAPDSTQCLGHNVSQSCDEKPPVVAKMTDATTNDSRNNRHVFIQSVCAPQHTINWQVL